MPHHDPETCLRPRETIMAKLPSDNPHDRRDAPDEDDEPRGAHERAPDDPDNPLQAGVTKNNGVKNN